jgi:AraC-like DNA-binding protein
MNAAHEFEHLSGQLTSKEIGLGWLDRITLRTAAKTVPVKAHLHRHMEIILCLRGEFTYKVEGFDPVVLGADTGMVIPAMSRHALENDSELPGERLGLHLLGKITKKHDYAIFSDADYLSFQQTLSTAAAKPFRLTSPLKDAARELARYLKGPALSAASPEHGFIRILCCSILYNLVKDLSGPPVATKPQLMEEAVRYLKAHFTEPFRIEDLVRHMGYSRASLFSLFKRHTGLTPNEYLVRLRIGKAGEMLGRGKSTVGETALAAGFKSQEYFSAVFRRYTGLTPSEFSRRVAAGKITGQSF